MAEIEIVKLKNGTVEAKILVHLVVYTLNDLMQENAIAFYELVQKAKDHNHTFWGDTESIIRKVNFRLLEPDGSLHDSIRNIILASVEGDGLEMKMVKPY